MAAATRSRWGRRPALLLLLALLQLAFAYEKYLFLPDAATLVEELVGEAELDRVKEGREPCAVMYYSPTCPHCTYVCMRACVFVGAEGPVCLSAWP